MLQTEIVEAKLTIAQQVRFRKLMMNVVLDDGRVGTMEQQYIQHLFVHIDDKSQTEMADMESLWKHSELVLKASITVAVLSGRYPITHARRVSRMAQQFGFSAKRLRTLEEQALRAIQYRGKQMNMDVTRNMAKNIPVEETTAKTGELSYSDFMQGLWQSDADLIQHTQHTDLDWDDSDEE